LTKFSEKTKFFRRKKSFLILKKPVKNQQEFFFSITLLKIPFKNNFKKLNTMSAGVSKSTEKN